ncbi:hypothetical protein GCM10010430_77200 [Kitasatospora cystarginea]|uniref:Uncharacterized protein n=1 Tax=Kitasatospora cystarginea TaxID=58350 RepID=A0ABN3F1D0_9ACTN
MTLRKATMVKRVEEAVRLIDPADPPIATFGVFPGRSPWVTCILLDGVVRDSYFVTVTARAVHVHDVAPRYRPGGLVHSLSRDDAAQRIAGLRHRLLWSSFHFLLPGDTVPTPMNVRRVRRPELERFTAALAEPRQP